jgi:alpha-tubulin suppressor-like RCC1 family protein
VDAGSHHTVGLDTNGRVLAAGDNRHGQCEVEGWRDIVAVAAGSTHTLGLRSDGTVVSAGLTAADREAIRHWHGIAAPCVGQSPRRRR